MLAKPQHEGHHDSIHWTMLVMRDGCPLCDGQRDCEAHAVDWRARALAAESRLAEERKGADGLAEVTGTVEHVEDMTDDPHALVKIRYPVALADGCPFFAPAWPTATVSQHVRIIVVEGGKK